MLSSRLLQKAAFVKPNTTSSSSIRTISSLLPYTNTVNTVNNSKSKNQKMKMSTIRSFSDLNIPSPPTSIHPHVAKPDAKGSLIYTETDEAPALATFSLLPILTKVS